MLYHIRFLIFRMCDGKTLGDGTMLNKNQDLRSCALTPDFCSNTLDLHQTGPKVCHPLSSFTSNSYCHALAVSLFSCVT